MNTSQLLALKKNSVELSALNKITEFLGDSQKITIRQRLWHVNNDCYEIPTCKTCKIIPVGWSIKNLAYSKYCSSKCVHSDNDTRIKRENTCLEKYGYTTNLKDPTNIQKQKDTCIEKYGVDNFAKTKQFSEKFVATCMERYGVSNVSKLPSVKDKIDETHLIRYGRKRQSQNVIPLDIIDLKNDEITMRKWFFDLKMPVSEIAEILRIGHSQLCNHFKQNLNIDISRHNVSTAERKLGEYLHSIGIQFISSDRTILKPKELDIFIPSHNLAIELNGLAWHGELLGKDKLYHVNKMNGCNSQNIRLIQILDCEWRDKQELVKSRLSGILHKNATIGARKCVIKQLTHQIATDFFNSNHIQGSCTQSFAYGLYYNNTLVAAMSFCKSRYNKKYEWELLRYANCLYTNVIGGAGKLFSHFVKNIDPTSVVSYCDLRWNTGDVYEKIGFSKISQSNPNYWYTKSRTTIESRIKYQKHKLAKLLLKFDPHLTEWENMCAHGYDRIWDCGNLVFVYKKC